MAVKARWFLYGWLACQITYSLWLMYVGYYGWPHWWIAYTAGLRHG